MAAVGITVPDVDGTPPVLVINTNPSKENIDKIEKVKKNVNHVI